MEMPTWYDLKQGVRVRCIYQALGRLGKTGTVLRAKRTSPSIIINWDDGCSDLSSWGNPGSFEIIEE
jgi:hypothetical protein